MVSHLSQEVVIFRFHEPIQLLLILDWWLLLHDCGYLAEISLFNGLQQSLKTVLQEGIVSLADAAYINAKVLLKLTLRFSDC